MPPTIISFLQRLRPKGKQAKLIRHMMCMQPLLSWKKNINLPFAMHQIKLASKYLLGVKVYNCESG